MLLVEVTPAGKDLAKHVEPDIVTLELGWVSCLADHEQQDFVRMCGALQASVSAALN